LYTITLDTYKAARLNSILSLIQSSSLKSTFRIDPIENVLQEKKRREAINKARN
jgi:hypothetical protein